MAMYIIQVYKEIHIQREGKRERERVREGKRERERESERERERESVCCFNKVIQILL